MIRLAGFIIFAILTVYGLDHGILVGAYDQTIEKVVHKNCRYLFLTGVSEAPALGGPLEQGPRDLRGQRLPEQRDDLYCRLFRD